MKAVEGPRLLPAPAPLHDPELAAGAEWAGVDVSGELAGVRMLHCDLTRADVSKATLAGTALHGSTLEGLRGADALRGAVIASDQVMALTIPLLVAMGTAVDDDYLI